MEKTAKEILEVLATAIEDMEYMCDYEVYDAILMAINALEKEGK